MLHSVFYDTVGLVCFSWSPRVLSYCFYPANLMLYSIEQRLIQSWRFIPAFGLRSQNYYCYNSEGGRQKEYALSPIGSAFRHGDEKTVCLWRPSWNWQGRNSNAKEFYSKNVRSTVMKTWIWSGILFQSYEHDYGLLFTIWKNFLNNWEIIF